MKALQTLHSQKWAWLLFMLFCYIIIIGVFTVTPIMVCNATFAVSTNLQFCSFYNITIFVFFGFCVVQLCAVYISGTITKIKGLVFNNRKNEKYNVDKKTVVILPFYGESKDEIEKSLKSVQEIDYPKENMLLVMVVDGIHSRKGTNESVASVLLRDVLKTDCQDNGYKFMYKCSNNPYALETNYALMYKGMYADLPYVVLIKQGAHANEPQMGNRGKKDSIMMILKLLASNRIRKEYGFEDVCKNIGVDFSQFESALLMDADCIVDTMSLKRLNTYLHEKPNCIGVCGETRVSHLWNFLVFAQKFEYWYSHILLKSLESIFYQVFVLSGCFTMYRLEYLVHEDIIKSYDQRSPLFKDKYNLQIANILELGEDRYLSVLLMQTFPDKRLKYTTSTFCYTNVPNTINTLLCQRRRWTNSLFHCHGFLFSNPPKQPFIRHFMMYWVLLIEMWAVIMLPILIIVGTLLFCLGFIGFEWTIWFIMFFVFCFLQSLVIAILFFDWHMILYWPFYMIATPIFSIIVPIYSLWQADNLTWGKTQQVEIAV